MLLGDLAQPLEIALGRRQHAGRAGHRLDDDGGDGGGAVQIDEPLQLVGELRAVFRLALAEGLLLAVVGVRQMVDAGSIVPNILRLLTMPPTEMPPKPTP